ncbi:hypothetical protein Aduo_008743 [Ancylostoma duodenale]
MSMNKQSSSSRISRLKEGIKELRQAEKRLSIANTVEILSQLLTVYKVIYATSTRKDPYGELFLFHVQRGGECESNSNLRELAVHATVRHAEKAEDYSVEMVTFGNVQKEVSGDRFILPVFGYHRPHTKKVVEKIRKAGVSLSLDDTINLAPYSPRLATVVVADERKGALPAVGIMFEHVKKFLLSFHTDFFMTDDTNSFRNGFRRAFPSLWVKKLLYLWHMQQAMKRNVKTDLNNSDLLEPFVEKMRETCLLSGREMFASKYTSVLKSLSEQGEDKMAAYMVESWTLYESLAFRWKEEKKKADTECKNYYSLCRIVRSEGP